MSEKLLLEQIDSKLDVLIAHLGAGGKPAVEIGTQLHSEIAESVVNTVPQAGSVPSAPDAETDPYAGVDKDGVRWDKRIHSKAAKPKKENGTWKRRKGIKDELYAEVLAELKEEHSYMDDKLTVDKPTVGPFFYYHESSADSGTVETRAELDELIASDPMVTELTREEFDAQLLAAEEDSPIAVPKAPSAQPVSVKPKAPGIPKAPSAQSVSVKPQVMAAIKHLTVASKVEPNDIDELMAETFEGVDTIAKLTEPQLVEFKVLLDDWIAEIGKCFELEASMKAIAEPVGHIASLEEGIKTILEGFNVDCFGLVHYSQIDELITALTSYLASWESM